MLRVEDKYWLPQYDFIRAKEIISAVLSMDQGQQYEISSLYFDDIYDTDLYNTIAGVSQRRKMRIRIYNDSFSTIKLEVKNKNYSRIEKLSSSITLEEMKKLMNGEIISWNNNWGMDPRNIFNERIITTGLRPKVIVTYDRSAYCCDSGNTRITFDSNVRASNQIELFGKPDLNYDDLKGANSILEVKYNEFLPDYVSKMINVGNMQQTSFSKYRLCREIYE